MGSSSIGECTRTVRLDFGVLSTRKYQSSDPYAMAFFFRNYSEFILQFFLYINVNSVQLRKLQFLPFTRIISGIVIFTDLHSEKLIETTYRNEAKLDL